MRIGFDAKRLYYNYTGLGNYSRALVKNLQEYYSNEEYYLYTTKLKKSPETAFFYNNPSIQTHLTKAVFKSYWRSFSIVDQLKKDNIELYHGLSNEIPTSLANTNIKSIVTIHDLIFKILPDTYSFIDRSIYDLKFRKSCLYADRIISISESTKNDIVRLYGVDPEKIEVIYQSCNPLFYEQPANADSDNILQKYGIPSEYLLFVGSITERKNLKLILDAYQHLQPGFKIPLVVIGGGRAHKKKLMDFVSSQKIENKVLWVDNLKDNSHLMAVYQKAMALIYPSFYEGFGLPVVEALLSKTPVITSNVSSLPEAGGPQSFYVNPNDSEEMADAITQVLTKTALRETMISSGYQYAIDTFSPDKVTAQLIQCYEKVLRNN